jgi:hypothetical protein
MNLPEHSSEKSGFAVVLELDSGTVLYGHFEARDYELEFLHSPDKADIHPTRERAQEDIDCFHKDDGSFSGTTKSSGRETCRGHPLSEHSLTRAFRPQQKP